MHPFLDAHGKVKAKGLGDKIVAVGLPKCCENPKEGLVVGFAQNGHKYGGGVIGFALIGRKYGSFCACACAKNAEIWNSFFSIPTWGDDPI